jgi:hypothetical protein
VRTKALRDQSKTPESALDRARTEMRETLLRGGFALSPEPETRQAGPLAPVICSYCAERAYTVEDIRHEGWCIYVDGPVCPDVPN